MQTPGWQGDGAGAAPGLGGHLTELLDSLTGPGLLLDVVGTQFSQLRGISDRGPAEAVELAAQFAEHAGWLHQDSGNLDKAL